MGLFCFFFPWSCRRPYGLRVSGVWLTCVARTRDVRHPYGVRRFGRGLRSLGGGLALADGFGRSQVPLGGAGCGGEDKRKAAQRALKLFVPLVGASGWA